VAVDLECCTARWDGWAAGERTATHTRETARDKCSLLIRRRVVVEAGGGLGEVERVDERVVGGRKLAPRQRVAGHREHSVADGFREIQRVRPDLGGVVVGGGTCSRKSTTKKSVRSRITLHSLWPHSVAPALDEGMNE
jgi:hypothetical protein